MIPSYPSVYQIGHKAVYEILCSQVVVEEKVDGSQFSFGVIDGKLNCRSKNVDITEVNDTMFSKAVATAAELKPILHDGWIYRTEYLWKPRHNTIEYARIPEKHLIGYDIEYCPQGFLTPAEKCAEFSRIGLECVPLFYEGVVVDLAMLRDMLGRTSVLGGSTIEGVVVKNYSVFTPDKRVAMAKLVRQDFVESNQENWKKEKTKSVIEKLASVYGTEARWVKAVQHLRDNGSLVGEPKDIQPLIMEIFRDFNVECADDVKELLYQHFLPEIQHMLIKGFPLWAKDRLQSKDQE